MAHPLVRENANRHHRPGWTRRLLTRCALALVVAGAAPRAMAAIELFDWEVPGQPAQSNVIPAPILTNANAASVSAILAAQGNGTKAVKVTSDLTNPASLAIFNTYSLKYVFADYESGNTVARTSALLNQVRSSSASSGAYVGNFNFYTGTTNYTTSGVNMSNPALYPGTFGPHTGGPNIRSMLFTTPLVRMSQAEAAAPGTHQVPYTTRFNSWLVAELDTDNNPANGYAFDATATSPNVSHRGQMLSRGDFRAMVLHQRLRGADALHLFETGVQGYTKTQLQTDATAGWDEPLLSSYYANNQTLTPLTTSTSITIDGTSRTFNQSGVVFSAINRANTLAILLSNLSDTNYALNRFSFGNLGGTAFATLPNNTIGNGTHHLLEFQKQKGQWALITNGDKLLFSGITGDSRFVVGVPEPGSLGLAAIAGLMFLRRPTRRI